MKRIGWWSFLFALIVVAVLPSMASANAGTPLMWASMLHLVFGNAAIGFVEGLLVSWIFSCAKRRAVPILIVANYASAWAGGFLLARPLSFIPDMTIENIRLWLCVFTIIAFLMTLLIELPFVWLAMRVQRRGLRRAFSATLVVHGVTYLLLIGWYWMASGTTMVTQLQVVPATDLLPGEQYALYFISPDGNEVIRSDLTGGQQATLRHASAEHPNSRLFVRQSTAGAYDLFVHVASDGARSEDELIVEDFADLAPVDWHIKEGHSENSTGTWFNVGPVPTLAAESDWVFDTGFWPMEGIVAVRESKGVRRRFSLETPFAAWIVRNATHLEGDRVVFQLGYDQICVLAAESRRIALIARGKGPVVAKPKDAPSTDQI